MGNIKNTIVIVHDYDKERITNMRNDAILCFSKNQKLYENKDFFENNMISKILESCINEEYTFMIMGDCSKEGWDLSDKFNKIRERWIKKMGKRSL